MSMAETDKSILANAHDILAKQKRIEKEAAAIYINLIREALEVKRMDVVAKRVDIEAKRMLDYGCH
jgi:hypothetical protein